MTEPNSLPQVIPQIQGKNDAFEEILKMIDAELMDLRRTRL